MCHNITEHVRKIESDSTGINLSDTDPRHSRARDTGLNDRGWPKFHTLGDIDSGEIIAYALTDGSVGYSQMPIVLAETAL